MKARLVKESVPGYENGIPWSGKDVVKAQPIGKIITKPMDFGDMKFPSTEYEVVEILEPKGREKIYICNQWHKEYKKIPQLVPEMFVEKFIPYESLKESIESGMWEVIFRDYGDNETVVEQKFNSEKEAKDWANDKEYDYTDIAIDDDGNDYWKTFYRFYNPEDNDNYIGYDIQQIN